MAEEGHSFGIIDRASLDKIDRLFACNVGEHVALPQLVVVGDQSSGKSSVLEALTELPFPRDSGLCTRFATHIIFRRSPKSEIAASIIPGKNSSESHREQVQAWSKTDLQVLDGPSFGVIMAEVMAVMGIGLANDDGLHFTTFSEDILRLEVSGPNQEHFSIIDVPGIFKRTTQGVTTKADRDLVDRMVRGYMENPRSVMLTVIPCNVDIATQEILERAEEVDPDGIRTLGVLTKPDLVDRGAEPAVLDLIEGKTHQLRLGWHMLRNPGQAELADPTSKRQEIERSFFASKAPWSQIDEDKRGVSSLRIRLQEIMAQHIRREFPKVKVEINQRLKLASKEIEQLGQKRQTQSEQIQFMMDIALKFQRIVSLAVRSEYSQSDIFAKTPEFRLATAAISRGEKFAETMNSYGHVFDFDPNHNGDIPENEFDEAALEKLALEENKTIDVREKRDHPDVADIVHENESLISAHNTGVLDWLKRVHLESRGFELGTFKASLLALSMKEQSRKWPSIALGYISDMVVLVHSLITGLLKEIVHDQKARTGIETLLIDHLRKNYQAAISHTEFLLKVELESVPATHNHYFNDTLEKGRQQRQQQQLSDKSLSDCKHGTVVPLHDIPQSYPLSNTDHVVIEVHDILRSYYKLACKRFVDCVRMQVADFLLITGPNTPLNLFSPTFVAAMTPDQLEEVAGEDAGVRRKRAQLEKIIKQLEEGKKILR